MTRRCKTPPALARVIMERQPAMIAHIEEMIRVKTSCPLDWQADHIKNQSVAEMVARAEGWNICLEIVMHEFNCYAGFHNYGPEQRHENGSTSRMQVSSSDSEFREWRKLYYTNGIAK